MARLRDARWPSSPSLSAGGRTAAVRSRLTDVAHSRKRARILALRLCASTLVCAPVTAIVCRNAHEVALESPSTKLSHIRGVICFLRGHSWYLVVDGMSRQGLHL